MNRTRVISILFSLYLSVCCCQAVTRTKVDVLIIGGGASGVSAGLQSARLGANTLIVEESLWLGGMLTSAGVSAVDGNNSLPAGIFGEFKQALARHYGSEDALKTGWVSNVLFEPSVGNRIFHEMVAKESQLKVWHEAIPNKIKRSGNSWQVTIQKKGEEPVMVEARILIDATELGDVAKACGVPYDIGMESKADTHESIAPDSANHIIQDMTYVATLKDYGKDVSMPRPEHYDPAEFACACINPLCVNPKEKNRQWPKENMITYGKLPNGKYMINWPIEGNDYYLNIIEMNREEREKALQYAKDATLRFVYFIQHELGYNHLALADDEYPTADRLPFIPYHRESRRIHGKVRFTVNHIESPYTQPQKLYRTAIAVGDYPVDHHHTRYHGYEDLPNLYFHPVPSFGLPLGVMIPCKTKNLIVAEKSISVSNIANGTTRLQPVVMQIGQAAGTLAALAVKQHKSIDQVSVRDVQDQVLNANGYLLPYLDVPLPHQHFKAYQRIGATGILKGEGKSVSWKNQTWLRADTLLLRSELDGLTDLYPYAAQLCDFTPVTLTAGQAVQLVQAIAQREHLTTEAQGTELWTACGLGEWNESHPVTRGEMAVLIDHALDPFHHKAIDITGNYIKK